MKISKIYVICETFGSNVSQITVHNNQIDFPSEKTSGTLQTFLIPNFGDFVRSNRVED